MYKVKYKNCCKKVKQLFCNSNEITVTNKSIVMIDL